jgi:hypothetical protein
LSGERGGEAREGFGLGGIRDGQSRGGR